MRLLLLPLVIMQQSGNRIHASARPDASSKEEEEEEEEAASTMLLSVVSLKCGEHEARAQARVFHEVARQWDSLACERAPRPHTVAGGEI